MMEISIGLSIMNNFSFPLTIRFITLINFACLRKTHLVESYNIYIDLSVIARCSSKYPCYIFMALTRFFVVVVFVSDYRIIITKMITENNAGNSGNAWLPYIGKPNSCGKYCVIERKRRYPNCKYLARYV